MATEADIIAAMRVELGDLKESFRDLIRGNGSQSEYDLSARNILPDTVVVTRMLPDGGTSTLDPDTEYTVSAADGVIRFVDPLEEDMIVRITGESYGIFSDDELAYFVDAAVGQHLQNRVVQTRYKDGHGFIRYDREPMTLATLPHEEKVLVAILSSIEALWALSTDASTDIDVQTSEGTTIPRGQRWRQLTAQIDVLTEKYERLSLAMGVGLFALETMDMRRISRQTGRLVPVFRPREYDESGPPVRKNLPVPTRSDDPDGPESPWFPSGWGF